MPSVGRNSCAVPKPPRTCLHSIRAVISTAWLSCSCGGSCCRAADAAVGKSHAGIGRQLRSELKVLALPAAQLRAQADDLARQLRELDVRIQQSNWEYDLME